MVKTLEDNTTYFSSSYMSVKEKNLFYIALLTVDSSFPDLYINRSRFLPAFIWYKIYYLLYLKL